MKKFALIGAAGYIASKHIKAIHDLGHELVAVADPNDNLEILDQFFPDCEYFSDTKELKAFIKSNPLDYITICSPSNLHAEHIELALKSGCHAICESPLVLSSDELDYIIKLEKKFDKQVSPILQYRLHPEIQKLKKEFTKEEKINCKLINHTYRGKWFSKSWKGDPDQSGGILTSLGYHFLDALIWIYGKPISLFFEEKSEHDVKGILELSSASIAFSLSNSSLTNKTKKQRELIINGNKIDFSYNDPDAYKSCYKEIINEKKHNTIELKTLTEILNKHN